MFCFLIKVFRFYARFANSVYVPTQNDAYFLHQWYYVFNTVKLPEIPGSLVLVVIVWKVNIIPGFDRPSFWL